MEMFAQHGYVAASTAQIAERAGVSEVTLFRHYPSKEALLLSDPFDPLLADAVRTRPVQETAMRALAEGIRQVWNQIDAERERQLRGLLRIVAQTPSLRGAIERSSEETVAALVDALVVRGVSETDARVAASATIGGLSAALLDWAQSENSPLDTTLASALAVLGGA